MGDAADLAEPADITTLAVIHPDRAAGWADVRAELDRLQGRGILQVASHPTPFEGRTAAGGIADALVAIAAGPRPALVLIVRGGAAAANTAGQSPKARLVVTRIEVCSQRRLMRWNSNCPPDCAKGR